MCIRDSGSAGWYNTAAFERYAAEDGHYAKTVNGDAYSLAIKEQVIQLIKQDFGKIDMLIYSLAAPRRTAADGTVYTSVLKTTGKEYTNKTIDLRTNQITEVTVPSANEEEIFNTIKVMGGEDWKDWIRALKDADAIESDAVTVAFSYIGPEITHPMYLDGSIGKAKDHLFETSKEINREFDGIKAYISVNKALVTQSSTAIPVVPLYISILYKVMKDHCIHEGSVSYTHLRVFDNLLRNAVNYSYPNTNVHIYVNTDDRGVTVNVRNSGDEIPPQKIERIFEKFFRVDAARGSQRGGAGLGLAIAKHIVELHGGEIWVRSNKDYTEFSVWLPKESQRQGNLKT